MSAIKDGGPAFPCHTNPLPGKLANAPQGMTMRQYYKAAALGGMISNMDILQQVDALTTSGTDGFKVIATMAARYADAMLAEDERAKT